ncbi:hypothetical protein V8F20_007761 [Naviculisporaceae sp. PSN 640]
MTNLLDIPQTPTQKKRPQDEDDNDSILDRLPSFEEVALTKNLLDPSTLRSTTTSPFSQDGRLSPTPPHHTRGISPAPSHHSTYLPSSKPPKSWKDRLTTSLRTFWLRYRPMILVAFSQFFGALMNLAARILEFDGENGGMHPFQILFFRMSITTVCSCIYMYFTKVPHFPLGAKEVRWLLVIRGVTGFFGIFPLWLSLMYLPLAEATVISFLAPGVAGWICHLFIGTPFTRREMVASGVALLGVVLIARPTSLFQGASDGGGSAAVEVSGTGTGNTTSTATGTHRHSVEDATPAERLTGIAIGLVGVLGAAGAFSAIRCIGTRAHPLISVNYFSVWCTIVSSTALILAPILNIGQPDIRFGMPTSVYQWALLVSLGVCGFVMQFLLTSGLGASKEKSNKANAMVYTHMLWAAGFDRFIFGHEMGGFSLVGCGLIIGGALWVALSKKEGGEKGVVDEVDMEERGGRTRGPRGESVPMMGGDVSDEEDETDGENGIPLRARVNRATG